MSPAWRLTSRGEACATLANVSRSRLGSSSNDVKGGAAEREPSLPATG